jgi:diaminohydroxyphosphoribosylaminopyrimidine deaminase/5-amino-6-(5-phosphoribosylamino)uracil reductase
MEQENMQEDKNEDLKWMAEAINLSLEAIPRSSPNPPVGAVIVKDGQRLAQGATMEPGKEHAEIVALKKAEGDSLGATLYVTLEPCSTFGRTPPCTEAIIQAKIKRVVISSIDLNPAVKGNGIKSLQDAGIQVDILTEKQEETRAIFHPFFSAMLRKRPEYIMKAAITLDGFLATNKKDSKWISHSFSRVLVHRLRTLCDGIMVGIGTVRADDPGLDIRLDEKTGDMFKKIYYSGILPEKDHFSRYLLFASNLDKRRLVKEPARIILDSSLSLSSKSQIATTAGHIPVIIFINQKKASGLRVKIRKLEKMGCKIFPVKPKGKGLELDAINKVLIAEGILRVLVEGGSTIHKSFMDGGLYDRYFLFVAGKFLKGSNGISLFAGKGIRKMSDAHKLPDAKAIILPTGGEDKVLNILFTGVENHVYGNS